MNSIYLSIYTFGATNSFLLLKCLSTSVTNGHYLDSVSKIQSSYCAFLVTNKDLSTSRIKGEAADVSKFIIFILRVTRSTVLYTTKYLEKFSSSSTINSYLIGSGNYEISAVGIEVSSYWNTACLFRLLFFGGLKCLTTIKHLLFRVLRILLLIFQII